MNEEIATLAYELSIAESGLARARAYVEQCSMALEEAQVKGEGGAA